MGRARAKTPNPSTIHPDHAEYLERLHQLRPRQHPDRARRGDPAERRGLPNAAPRVRHPDQAEAVVPAPRARGRARRARQGLAGQVIESLVGEWKPDDFENEYRRDLKAMLDAKLAGEQIARPEPVAETPVVDLMEALRRSVADAQGRKGGAGSKKTKAASKSNGSSGGSRRKTSARKSA